MFVVSLAKTAEVTARLPVGVRDYQVKNLMSTYPESQSKEVAEFILKSAREGWSVLVTHHRD